MTEQELDARCKDEDERIMSSMYNAHTVATRLMHPLRHDIAAVMHMHVISTYSVIQNMRNVETAKRRMGLMGAVVGLRSPADLGGSRWMCVCLKHMENSDVTCITHVYIPRACCLLTRLCRP